MKLKFETIFEKNQVSKSFHYNKNNEQTPSWMSPKRGRIAK
jgi:hypothetical protein